jgi:hypothetical protein
MRERLDVAAPPAPAPAIVLMRAEEANCLVTAVKPNAISSKTTRMNRLAFLTVRPP